MPVIVLGGTRSIGRAIAEALTAAGHAVLVAHRGISEPADLHGVEHLTPSMSRSPSTLTPRAWCLLRSGSYTVVFTPLQQRGVILMRLRDA
jgi:NAD(P)-dependent dehydrogenase (short-subunit alcohol dehydrogenase family)